MPDFQLDEAAVANVERLLQDTGEKVMAEARAAEQAITGIAGGTWRGSASRAASAKQTEELYPVALKLQGRINHIAEALGQGRVLTVDEDDFIRQSLEGIPAGAADKFGSRL